MRALAMGGVRKCPCAGLDYRGGLLQDEGDKCLAILGVVDSEGLLIPAMVLEGSRTDIAESEESEREGDRSLARDGESSPFDNFSKEVGAYVGKDAEVSVRAKDRGKFKKDHPQVLLRG